MSMKLAIVILNYLNFKDTEECIESIFERKYKVCGVIVVDNGSGNGSYEYLAEKYDNNEIVHIIAAKKNLGFAKGNNLGIRYARKKLKAEYVFVVNNDTVFTDDKYFDKLLTACDEETGVVRSNIRIPGNELYQEGYLDLHYPWVLRKYLDYFFYVHDMQERNGKIPHNKDKSKKTQILCGCALLFTPAFFRHYKGFYPRTFLYCEEAILCLMCERYNLKQVKVENTELYHKEDQSSELSFNNEKKIKVQHQLKSYKYVIWNWLITRCVQKMRCIHQ